MSDSLAELLVQATENPALRDEFYQRFLLSDIYVPVNSAIPEGAVVFEISGEEKFTWAVATIKGAPTVPAFTSQALIDDFFSKVQGWEGRYITSQGGPLLMNLSASSILALEINPASEHGLRMSPETIKSIVDIISAKKP